LFFNTLKTFVKENFYDTYVYFPFGVYLSIVEVTVKSQKGTCAFGHKVGDKIVFDGKTIQGNICYSALMVVLPKVYAMRYSAEFPWAESKDIIYNACPDPKNPVVFEIKRLRK
jgi:uncharacterized repeat protein (TIGR04076 family)